MRAYCETDDCNTTEFFSEDQYQKVVNFGYEKSPYHGSIAHFHRVTFNDYKDVDPQTGIVTEIKGLETMFNEFKDEKKARKKVDSLLTRFLDFFDMSYVSLRDIPLERLSCTHDISEGSPCYIIDTEKTVKFNDFIKNYTELVRSVVDLNYKDKDQVDLQFQDIMDNGYRIKRASSWQKKLGVPWGFMVPSYNNWGMERCEFLSGTETAKICNPSVNLKAAYIPPTLEELEEIIRYPFPSKSGDYGEFPRRPNLVKVCILKCATYLYLEKLVEKREIECLLKSRD